MPNLRIPRYPISLLLRRGALAYLIVWQLSPPLAYGNIWRALALLAMLLWLALDTLAPRSVLRRPSWPVLGCALFLLYTSLVEWLIPDSTPISAQFQVWIMFFFLLVGESHQRGRGDEARFCFWVMLLVLPIWTTTTLLGLTTIDSQVSRVISRSSVASRELVEQGIGGFWYVYAVVLCVPFLAQLALRRSMPVWSSEPRWKRRAKRLLILGNLILAVLLVLQAQYAIALLLSLLAIACVLLVRSRHPQLFAISILLVCLLGVTAVVSINPVLNYLEGVAAGTTYSTKVRDVRLSLNEEQSTGTVTNRAVRYAKSLRTFSENPVTGSLTRDQIGKHSAIIDRFAQFGFVVGFMFLALMAYLPLRYLRWRQVPIGLAMAFIVVAVGFPMLNSVIMVWGLILFVFSRGALSVMGIPLESAKRRPAVNEGTLA